MIKLKTDGGLYVFLSQWAISNFIIRRAADDPQLNVYETEPESKRVMWRVAIVFKTEP